MMVILGLGSNIGDRLANLRLAKQYIAQLPNITIKQVSPVYLSDALLPENAPTDWNQPYLNAALRCETTLEPIALLQEIKKIELLIGRKKEALDWAPRVIDIDILAWEDLVIDNDVLTIPHAHLQERPFALWPLADIAPFWKFPLAGKYHHQTAAKIVAQWGSRFTGEASCHTRQIPHRIDTPHLVGVINVTPNSFSDGGQFLAPEQALQQAIALINAGATILDIGAEATAPQVEKGIDANTEWERLEPVLSLIQSSQNKFLFPPVISIDTRHPETAKKALANGANWINDVTGLDDPHMRDLIADTKADCIVMHHLDIPVIDDQHLPLDQDPIQLVYAWAENRIETLIQHGIKKEKIIFDPGIGFGKTTEQSVLLLQHAHVFHTLGVRVLIGHSRKRFLFTLTGNLAKDRDIETMAIALSLAKYPIDYLRVHHVEMCVRALKMGKLFE